MALSGNLISPSRGLLVYVPVLFFVAYLLARYRRDYVAQARSAFRRHYRGASGGHFELSTMARRLVLRAALFDRLGSVVRVARHSRNRRHATLARGECGERIFVELASTACRRRAACVAMCFIHARGAASIETARWNASPVNVDVQPDRVWEWRYPQFMAGLILPPLPAEFPFAPAHIDFGSPEFEKFKWYGWSTSEEQFRWTETNEAGMAFTLDKTDYSSLQIKLGTFLVPGKLDAQRVNIVLNEKSLHRSP
jgi:hypothetical protein